MKPSGELGISASRHPVGDLTCFMGWLYGVAFCAIGRAGKEREAHLQRGVGIEQLGTGRVEDPFWKAVADLSKTHAASRQHLKTRELSLQCFQR